NICFIRSKHDVAALNKSRDIHRTKALKEGLELSHLDDVVPPNIDAAQQGKVGRHNFHSLSPSASRARRLGSFLKRFVLIILFFLRHLVFLTVIERVRAVIVKFDYTARPERQGLALQSDERDFRQLAPLPDLHAGTAKI